MNHEERGTLDGSFGIGFADGNKIISGVNLSGPDFLARKDKIVAALEHQIGRGDLERMSALRRNKRTL